MLKLNFQLLDQPIEIKGATTLVLEDVQVFSQVVQGLYQYGEGTNLKLFDETQCSVKPAELIIVTDVLGYDVNSPAILKLIYRDLEEQLNEKPEVKSMIEKLTGTLTELIGYELLNHELDLAEDEITLGELFKALGIKIETQSDTIFEKSIEILQVYTYLSKKRLLVFVNTCAYLTPEELQELQAYITLCNREVLFIEPRKVPLNAQYILDEDYFLHEENDTL